MTDPIRKSVTVPLRPTEAFDLFTKNLSDWWPLHSHSLSAGDGDIPKDVTVEEKEGGHIIETKPNGETGKWGTITRWDPGTAFGVSWYVGRPIEEATDLLVVFTPTDTGTRVDLTHGGFDRLAETALAQRYDTGWNLVLGECYLKAAQQLTTTILYQLKN